MIDHNTVSRWLKKFHPSSYKNLDETKTGRPKTMDFEAVLQAIETNLESLAIHCLVWFMTSVRVSGCNRNVLHVTKIGENF